MKFHSDPGLWARLSPILDTALDLPPERREAYLEQACGDDSHMRRLASSLLVAAEQPSAFLDRPLEISSALLRVALDAGEAAGDGNRAAVESQRHFDSGAARFLPGSIIGRRHRIISLVGRGGMGEVYRADDLRLGMPVALKFLPPRLERESPQLQHLLRELRVARQIAHPNVCRVWDIEDHEGAAYLTMEFVDGESLDNLLRRIGRLPRDKALDVARQVCAGLAATHDENILHRDLKPGNVMIDGRGRVRIVDFGIAGLADETQRPGTVIGTPGYMSPEQLAGRDVTVRSDIYVLGLLLYQLFTGRRAFEAETVDELRRLQEEIAPIHPRRLVEGLAPSIDRIIMKCLSYDPADRPASAQVVAAALPGGDQLEAVLAAGETPSPDLVAASGPHGTLAPRVVLLLGGLWCVLFSFALATAGKTTLVRRVPFHEPVAALASKARATLESLGYPDPPIDSMDNLWREASYIGWLRHRQVQGERWAPLEAPGSLGVFYTYRESSRYLIPKSEGGGFGPFFPEPPDPPLAPGDAFVWSDLRGRLRFLEAIPLQPDFTATMPSQPDWGPLFTAAGLSPADFQPTAPTRIPMIAFDTRAAWSGVLHDAGDIPVRLEAAAWRGRPVFFQCVFPFNRHWSASSSNSSRLDPSLSSFSSPLWTSWVLLVPVVGGWLAFRNRRLQRADRRGAARLFAFVFTARFLFWVFSGHHVPVLFSELELLAIALGRSLLAATVVWALFTALEPEIRRLWPRALPGWNRLLAGRFRDPLVGHDLFIGSISALSLIILWDRLGMLVPAWRGVDSLVPPTHIVGHFFTPRPQPLLGGRFIAGGVLTSALSGLYVSLAVWVLMLGLRLVLRKNWLAAVAFVVFWTAQSSPAIDSQFNGTGLACGLAGALLIWTILQRFGVLAVTSGAILCYLWSSFPMTTDVSAPYFGVGLVGILASLTLASCAAFISLGRQRPLISL